MKPLTHLFITFVLMGLLYPFFRESVLYLLIGGCLIDIDHYFWYVFKFKNLNIIKCYNEFDKGKFRKKKYLLIFHTTGFMGLLLLFSVIFSQYLLLIGYMLHMIMDGIKGIY